MNQYFIIHKPFQVLSQFSSQEGKKTLADYFDVPKDVYPVGRLDYDSEGLLILTNDTQLNHRLLAPQYKHKRTYWVQVEGLINQESLMELERGVTISIDGKLYKTMPCKAVLFEQQPNVAVRVPPIRVRQNIPTSWISLTLTEGKNRQVRKMTAKAGFPTLRLIRYQVEKLTIEHLLPGDMQELTSKEIYQKLFNNHK